MKIAEPKRGRAAQDRFNRRDQEKRRLTLEELFIILVEYSESDERTPMWVFERITIMMNAAKGRKCHTKLSPGKLPSLAG